ncbi:MAG: 2-oxoglutarate dehydrogenase E1 component [Gammaproteobacteria bacterium]|nr:2-oxoglutarate dehydrogenase E1 component [Gammaproteobacteria bacterium]
MSTESVLSAGNAELIELFYQRYHDNPESVSQEWREYFQGLDQEVPRPQPLRRPPPAAPEPEPPPVTEGAASRQQIAVLQLINAYRFRGHKLAILDPLKLRDRPSPPDLALDYHGLDTADLDHVFNAGSLVIATPCTLLQILDLLQQTYTRSIGAEYMHITDTAQKRWIQRRLESCASTPHFPGPTRKHILERITAGAGLEEYLHTKYVGQKRFSLEGGESLIPLMDEFIQNAGSQGIKETVVGMAHRGRLNVLVNVLGKKPGELFSEFEGKHAAANGSGDVKYHQGFSSDLDTPGGPVHVALAFNPSHLEIINPVVEGSVRARQEQRRDKERNQVLPILIHGDAALSGQGVVMETLNLSQTRGYTTGGTVHVVINNQIGFTTSDPLDSRSTSYCTDVAKLVQAPIFHVNGDDPEAVVFVTRVALDYRMAFKKDVVVDVICYRRHGHSEADEPAVTQPMMYQKIRHHAPVREVYRDRLVEEGVVTHDEAEQMFLDYQRRLENDEVVARPILTDYKTTYAVNWTRYNNGHWAEEVTTAVAKTDVGRLLGELTMVPEGFVLHPGVEKIMNARRRMARGEQALDWGAAETLAYATLLENGYPVRLSGQDSGRGTFFHRHAVLHNQENGERYIPLQHMGQDQPQFLVIDSLLSEEAVLGFEVGYSASDPESLVIWEAQFGDFANNAQVVIDQFISSSVSKWQRFSGLVMFLPHGYDGQGPEHSSARLERYLQLCAEDNMQVCYPSTPAQMFHMLRRQMLRAYRRPLVVMSPKSLLRHKLSTSSLDDLAEGGFQTVIDEADPLEPQNVKHVLLCSGKVYFDLLEARRSRELADTAIVRLEQLYPFPEDDVLGVLEKYTEATTVRWVQEEPWNQGSWFYMHPHLKHFLKPNQALDCATRPQSASPAVGYLHKHIEQQKTLVNEAFEFAVATVEKLRSVGGQLE